jgi:hypothetical protein
MIEMTPHPIPARSKSPELEVLRIILEFQIYTVLIEIKHFPGRARLPDLECHRRWRAHGPQGAKIDPLIGIDHEQPTVHIAREITDLAFRKYEIRVQRAI